MATAQQWLDVITNNLANASTTGFKRDGVTFNDGLVRKIASSPGLGRPLGSLGSGAVIKTFYTDFSIGSLSPTGNPLDLAVKDKDGVFAVQTPGGVRYTRDGAFQLNSDLQIVDKTGRPVLNNDLQPITVEKGQVEVAEDGRVLVKGKLIDHIGVFRGTLVKQGQNLYSSTNAQPLENAMIASGSLESSNVNAVEEMIAMIRLNRAFELAQRSIQSQDESSQRLVSSMSGR